MSRTIVGITVVLALVVGADGVLAAAASEARDMLTPVAIPVDSAVYGGALPA